MSKEFDDALNDCLERIASGEELEACLGDYPAFRQDLVPLMQLAQAMSNVAATTLPNPEAKSRNFQRFMMATRTIHRSPDQFSWLSTRWIPLARPIAISLGAIMLLIMTAGVATAASSDSIPGDRLYWVKTTKETIQLNFPRSNASRAEAYAHLAAVRGREMSRLVERGRLVDAEFIMKRMNHHLGRSAIHAGVDVTPLPEMPRVSRTGFNISDKLRLKASLERGNRNMRIELRTILLGLPPQERRQFRYFMRRSELGYRIIIEALRQDRSHGSVPFIRVVPTQDITGH